MHNHEWVEKRKLACNTFSFDWLTITLAPSKYLTQARSHTDCTVILSLGVVTLLGYAHAAEHFRTVQTSACSKTNMVNNVNLFSHVLVLDNSVSTCISAIYNQYNCISPHTWSWAYYWWIGQTDRWINQTDSTSNWLAQLCSNREKIKIQLKIMLWLLAYTSTKIHICTANASMPALPFDKRS